MDHAPSTPAKDRLSPIPDGSFTLDRMLSHIDPGPAEETEEFVRLIYEQRHTEFYPDSNGKTGR